MIHSLFVCFQCCTLLQHARFGHFKGGLETLRVGLDLEVDLAQVQLDLRILEVDLAQVHL